MVVKTTRYFKNNLYNNNIKLNKFTKKVIFIVL